MKRHLLIAICGAAAIAAPVFADEPTAPGGAETETRSEVTEGQTDQGSREEPEENLVDRKFELTNPSVDIAGPGDIVPPVNQNEEDVSVVARNSLENKAD